MTIEQNLPNIAFSQNVPDLIVGGLSAGESIKVSIILGETAPLSNIGLYADNQNSVTILSRQIAKGLAPISNPTFPWAASLPALTITITSKVETQTARCTLIPGGIDPKIRDVAEWLSRNFLTWQPQIIETTFEQPQQLYFVDAKNTSIKIYAKLYTQDGRSFTKQIGDPGSSAIFIYKYDVGYRDLWETFCKDQNLTPLCYDVYGTTSSSSASHPATPFTQRYNLREQRYNDVCFGFSNTLGGFDTLMMEGRIKLKPQGETETLTNNLIERELANGYTSYWEASTGYIDSRRMAAQYQDFLKSTNRWIYKDNLWSKIIVDEYKVEDSPLELNAYSFKYHLAEKNEQRYFGRKVLPEPELPIDFFKE